MDQPARDEDKPAGDEDKPAVSVLPKIFFLKKNSTLSQSIHCSKDFMVNFFLFRRFQISYIARGKGRSGHRNEGIGVISPPLLPWDLVSRQCTVIKVYERRT